MQDNKSIEIFLPGIPNPLIIDVDDYSTYKRKNWRYDKRTNSLVAGNPCYKTFRLSRMIMNVSDGMEVDHINHNRMDNRRCNLRVCTAQENCRNRRKYKNSNSKYKGVCWHKRIKKWQACIRLTKDNLIHIGYFETEEDAAKAYDKAAKKYYGEFACLNFNEGGSN